MKLGSSTLGLLLMLTAIFLAGNIATAFSQAAPEIRRAQDVSEATPAAPAATSAVAENYRLKSGDVIDVRVYQAADLSGQVRVREDGTVSLPLINEKVSVAGLTLSAVEQKIKSLLAKDYVKDPRVTTNVTEFGRVKFTVMGQVTSPNTYSVPNNKPVSVPEAIGKAGGPTRLGNMKKVYLKRSIGGKEKVWLLDAQEMSRTANGSVYISDGDVLEVTEKNF